MRLSRLAAQKIASQNRSDHSGRKWARNHSAAEIAGFFASPAAKKIRWPLAILGLPSKSQELSSHRPRPQVAAAARFCGRSDHGTLSFAPFCTLLRSFLNAHGSTPTRMFLTSPDETQTMVQAKLRPKLRRRQALYLTGKGETQTMV